METPDRNPSAIGHESDHRPGHDSPATTAAGGLTVKCAWCGKVIVAGGAVVSHGICPSCKEIQLAEIAGTVKA